MVRSDDITLPATTPWLHAPDTQAVCRALRAGGDEVYFVGGCVRDALLGVDGDDVDLSTAALPDTVIDLAEAAGLKAVPTGLAHGTVTVVSNGKGFEVTTFRRDVETDGRRAVVAFSDSIAEDARRRDFTLNALYATAEGGLVDPLGGLEDCLSRRIRFIEDADQRIQEDYLRILRFFRFHAWYADPSLGFDPETLDAIARNTHGLETLSAERIGSEIKRLLAAPDPAAAVAVMRQTGCLVRVLPGSDDIYLNPLVTLEQSQGVPPDPMRRLAALGGDVDALRLSKSEMRALTIIRTAAFDADAVAAIAYRTSAAIARDAVLLRAAVAGQPVAQADVDAIAEGAAARFPVSAADLMPAYEGPALGARLAELEAAWIASDFKLSREELMTLG